MGQATYRVLVPLLRHLILVAPDSHRELCRKGEPDDVCNVEPLHHQPSGAWARVLQSTDKGCTSVCRVGGGRTMSLIRCRKGGQKGAQVPCSSPAQITTTNSPRSTTQSCFPPSIRSVDQRGFPAKPSTAVTSLQSPSVCMPVSSKPILALIMHFPALDMTRHPLS